MSAKVIPEKIHLVAFRILQAEMNSPFEFDTNYIHSFEDEVKFDLAFSLEDNMVKTDFQVEIATISEEHTNEQEASANFTFVFVFNVENFKELATAINDETLDINGGLSNALASIVYSTSRGILMTRFQGTALADFILPIIDPAKLLVK
ncbi:MAG: hypothetical protein KJ941_11660 [Bacteroidetes bacterium]|nr:hypothetical protein [Bacteroidota bacterium]